MSFKRACALSEVPVGSVLAVDLGGDYDIAVVNTPEGLFAAEDRCSHADVPLSEGDVDGCTLECLAHGSRFDLRNGRPLEPPAVAPIPTYPVRVDGPDIFIDTDNPIDIQEQ
jgi:3-phenylpropionate/trans-cinnamate dioxygenase ferredoxin component